MGSGTIATTPGASVFARKRQIACNAILNATSRLIAEKGVDNFTISEVAQRAQINRALIYHYFKDRENLIAQAIGHIVDRYQPLQPAEGDLDAVERVTRMHIAHPEIARFFFQMLLTGRALPGVSERIKEAIDWVEGLEPGAGRGNSADPAIAMTMLVLLQLSWAFAREELARLIGTTVEEADERFIAQLQRAVGVSVQALTRPE